MSFRELSDAFVGFSHPHSSKRLAIVDHLESQIIKLVKEKNISNSDFINLASSISRAQIGSKPLVENLEELTKVKVMFFYKQFKDS